MDQQTLQDKYSKVVEELQLMRDLLQSRESELEDVKLLLNKHVNFSEHLRKEHASLIQTHHQINARLSSETQKLTWRIGKNNSFNGKLRLLLLQSWNIFLSLKSKSTQKDFSNLDLVNNISSLLNQEILADNQHIESAMNVISVLLEQLMEYSVCKSVEQLSQDMTAMHLSQNQNPLLVTANTHLHPAEMLLSQDVTAMHLSQNQNPLLVTANTHHHPDNPSAEVPAFINLLGTSNGFETSTIMLSSQPPAVKNPRLDPENMERAITSNFTDFN